jgi:hypothetical protein
VYRLLGAQQEALNTTSRALDAEAESLNEDERPVASERLKATLVNARNIREYGA